MQEIKRTITSYSYEVVEIKFENDTPKYIPFPPIVYSYEMTNAKVIADVRKANNIEKERNLIVKAVKKDSATYAMSISDFISHSRKLEGEELKKYLDGIENTKKNRVEAPKKKESGIDEDYPTLDTKPKADVKPTNNQPIKK